MDLQTVVYIVFLVIFLASRLYRAKKKQEEASMKKTVSPPLEDHRYPKPEKKKKPSLEEVFGEWMKEFEEQKTPEPEPEPPVVRKVPPAPKMQSFKERIEITEEDELEKKLIKQEGRSGFEPEKTPNKFAEEGGSQLFDEDDLMHSSIEDAEIGNEETKFEFDPREAFLIKAIFERPYK